MNVITLVSCKAGSGKTTLTADLAAHACGDGRRCLVIDADPGGGLARLNASRARGVLPLASARVLARQLEVADILGYDWVLIDTAPAVSAWVEEALRVTTMVIIPARPGLADLVAVSQTAEYVHAGGRPYLVVLNAVPDDGADAAAVVESRAWLARYDIPVWARQISERPPYLLAEGAAAARARSAMEVAALWSVIERTVEAVRAPRLDAGDAKRAA